MAFLEPCVEADGWEEYAEGAGKFLLGAGAGMLRPQGPHAPTLESGKGEIPLSEIKFGDQGGSEMHTLSTEEMPAHEHPVSNLEWGYDVDGNGKPARIEVDDGPPWDGVTGKLVAGPVGGGQPHNNMPPYIAVYFCKKT